MLSLPYVEDGACSGNLLTDGLSGEGVTTDNGQWMSMRWVEFGKDYAPFMKLEFAKGKNMDAPGQILVNETFLKMMPRCALELLVQQKRPSRIRRNPLVYPAIPSSGWPRQPLVPSAAS